LAEGPAPKPVTVHALLQMKEKRERIVMLTCYDALFARLLDASGVDVLLVGDSVNQVLAGAESTLSATLDQMIYHTKIVRRGAQRAMVVCDMPFLTYQVTKEEAIRNCGRALAETGCHAGKDCDGQVLVLPDLLGLNDRFSAKFVKRYANLADEVKKAVQGFAAEVREGKYPDPEHSFQK